MRSVKKQIPVHKRVWYRQKFWSFMHKSDSERNLLQPPAASKKVIKSDFNKDNCSQFSLRLGH